MFICYNTWMLLVIPYANVVMIFYHFICKMLGRAGICLPVLAFWIQYLFNLDFLLYNTFTSIPAYSYSQIKATELQCIFCFLCIYIILLTTPPVLTICRHSLQVIKVMAVFRQQTEECSGWQMYINNTSSNNKVRTVTDLGMFSLQQTLWKCFYWSRGQMCDKLGMLCWTAGHRGQVVFLKLWTYFCEQFLPKLCAEYLQVPVWNVWIKSLMFGRDLVSFRNL